MRVVEVDRVGGPQAPLILGEHRGDPAGVRIGIGLGAARVVLMIDEFVLQRADPRRDNAPGTVWG